AHGRLLDLAGVGIRSRAVASAAAEKAARTAPVVVVVFHRPAQLAPHPRAAPDAGHGSKVADVTAVAHDKPSTNCFFVLRGRKRLPNLCKRSAGARLVRPSGAGGIDGTNGCSRCVAIFDASIRRKALRR